MTTEVTVLPEQLSVDEAIADSDAAVGKRTRCTTFTPWTATGA